MTKLKGTYATYSIACFIVWALIFAIGLLFHIHAKNHAGIFVFCGWVIGWLSATIARRAYPR